MKKLLLLLALAVAPSFAHAASVDMNTQTCQDWLDATEDEQDMMAAWLRGYLAGRSTGAMFDLAGGRADASTLKAYCQKNPTIGLVTAAGQWRK